MESVQGRDISTERNVKLFRPVARELVDLLAKMPQGMNGVFYRGWIFLRQADGKVMLTKADSIMSLED